jgi:hypothetical protein
VKLCSYRYPTPGDVFEIEITGIGVLRTSVIDESEALQQGGPT